MHSYIPVGFVNVPRRINIQRFIYKSTKADFEKMIQTYNTNKSLLDPGVNDSIFCWLDPEAKNEVLQLLEIKERTGEEKKVRSTTSTLL